MKTGIELINDERNEQLTIHGRTVEMDVTQNGSYQLTIAAAKLLSYPADVINYNIPPVGWDIDLWKHMIEKPYTDRIRMAAALLAAELDRLEYLSTLSTTNG